MVRLSVRPSVTNIEIYGYMFLLSFPVKIFIQSAHKGGIGPKQTTVHPLKQHYLPIFS